MKQKEAFCELEIKDLNVEDSGDYTCVCGEMKTSATVKVNGMDLSGPPLLDLYFTSSSRRSFFPGEVFFSLSSYEKK